MLMEKTFISPPGTTNFPPELEASFPALRNFHVRFSHMSVVYKLQPNEISMCEVTNETHVCEGERYVDNRENGGSGDKIVFFKEDLPNNFFLIENVWNNYKIL